MQTITTVSGKVYEVKWCGPSTLDYALRFEIINGSQTDIFLTFIDPEETKELIHSFDGHETVFYNFTDLKGIISSIDGSYTVSLSPSNLSDAINNNNKPDEELEYTEEEIQEGQHAIELLNIIFGNE